MENQYVGFLSIYSNHTLFTRNGGFYFLVNIFWYMHNKVVEFEN